jgi:hypothetical protein
MPGRIHKAGGSVVRLNAAMLARVEHLAKLAHVTPSDVVNYVLAEVFEGEGQDQSRPEIVDESPGPVGPPRRSRGPASVIPITRNRCPLPPPRGSIGSVEFLCGDLDYLRLQAADLRRVAQQVRAHAVDACGKANQARHLAQDSLNRVRAGLTG